MKKNERIVSGLDSDLLRTFLAVAECRNLTIAAESLGRTQSAISVQVKKLERDLGVRLFDRRARGMHPTPEGEALQPAARSAVDGIDRIAGMFRQPLSGKVRVGIPDEMGHGFLETVLGRFSGQHPGVEIEIRCVNSTAFPDLIHRNKLDLAVHANRPGQTEGDVLYTETCVWAAAKSWKSAGDLPVPLALFDRACWWRDVAVAAMENAGIPYRVAVTSESTAGVLAALRAGLAVGMLERQQVTDDLRVLGSKDGFPGLPKSALCLLRRPDADGATIDAMDSAIRSGLPAATRR